MGLEAGDRGEGWEIIGVDATVLSHTRMCLLRGLLFTFLQSHSQTNHPSVISHHKGKLLRSYLSYKDLVKTPLECKNEDTAYIGPLISYKKLQRTSFVSVVMTHFS